LANKEIFMLPVARLVRLALLAAAAGLALSAQAADGGVPKPVIKIETEGKCIAPAEEMRLHHMEMLKHQRDKTLREGVRGAKVSLNGCIECHASKKTGSVIGQDDNFCQSCHAYAAVNLDCWDCHQPKAGYKAMGAKP
jgi:hypothetical protein